MSQPWLAARSVRVSSRFQVRSRSGRRQESASDAYTSGTTVLSVSPSASLSPFLSPKSLKRPAVLQSCDGLWRPFWLH